MITIKQGDTGVVVFATLKSDGSPYGLAGASVVIRLQARPGGTKTELPCTVDADPTTGKVSITLPVSLAVGCYDVEFRVTTPAMTTLTFPNCGTDTIELEQRI